MGGELSSGVRRGDLSRRGVRILNRGGFANPDVLLVPRNGLPALVVKDYATRSAPVRYGLAPLLLRRELALLQRVAGLPGLPAHAQRLDRFALCMEYIDGRPLSKRSHTNALPASFFLALEGMLDGLAERGVFHLDLRSPSNILVTGSRAPALVDLGSAVGLHLPRRLVRWVDRRALRKLRSRFEGERQTDDAGGRPWEEGSLDLGEVRIFYRDRGAADDPVPVLFLHDVGTTSLCFEPVLARAERFGRRGIGIDLPGFGASRRRVRSLHPRRLVSQIERMLDALRLERVDIVGYGWGGWLARQVQAQCPARVRLLRSAATGIERVWIDVARDPERLRRRLKASPPEGLSESQRARLEHLLDLVPARNLKRACESCVGDASAAHFWQKPPTEPDEVWRELASATQK